jgi:hypothetical protein
MKSHDKVKTFLMFLIVLLTHYYNYYNNEYYLYGIPKQYDDGIVLSVICLTLNPILADFHMVARKTVSITEISHLGRCDRVAIVDSAAVIHNSST